MTQLRTLGKYELLDALGAGGMGTVYRALDPVLQRVVAIKLLHREFRSALGSDDLWGRFRTEARAVARLNHPAIVSVYDFSDSDPAGPFFVMEYIDGSTLDAYMLREGDLTLEQKLDLMGQLLDGLGFAHARDIIHRDIKPSNLLVTSEGKLKIADFGVAKIGSLKQTQIGTAIGTPEYMAPEQYTSGYIDQRCDLYAAGTLLFQLLTGRAPFAGTTTSQIMYQTCHVIPEPVSAAGRGVSALFDPVLARALAKDPDDRFQSAWHFSEAIVAVRKALGVPASKPMRSPAAVAPATALRPFPRELSALGGAVRKEASTAAAQSSRTVAPAGVPIPAAPPTSAAPPTPIAPPTPTAPPTAVAPPLSALSPMFVATPLSVAPVTAPLAVPLAAARPEPMPKAAAITLPPVGWTAEQLSEVEHKLAQIMGPMARILIKRAAAQTRDRDQLYRDLARHLHNADERERFLSGIGPDRSAADGSPSAPIASENMTRDPIAPATLDRTAQILMRYLGPIAVVIVKKTAPTARNERDLYAQLAQRITVTKERERFISEVTRRPG